MRVLQARGPVVEALRRYDPGLRVRWSWEKRKWAVDAPLNIGDRDPSVVILPPVRYEQVKGDMYVEHLLPERSERMIQYHDNRYVVCYAEKLDDRLVRAIVSRDSHRHKHQMVGQFDEQQEALRVQKERDEAYRRSERVYEGWDRFKYGRRKLGHGAEDGTGVSIKGMA